MGFAAVVPTLGTASLLLFALFRGLELNAGSRMKPDGSLRAFGAAISVDVTFWGCLPLGFLLAGASPAFASLGEGVGSNLAVLDLI